MEKCDQMSAPVHHCPKAKAESLNRCVRNGRKSANNRVTRCGILTSHMQLRSEERRLSVTQLQKQEFAHAYVRRYSAWEGVSFDGDIQEES